MTKNFVLSLKNKVFSGVCGCFSKNLGNFANQKSLVEISLASSQVLNFV